MTEKPYTERVLNVFELSEENARLQAHLTAAEARVRQLEAELAALLEAKS